MHQKAYENAQLLGNHSYASLHKQYLVVRRLHAGVCLPELRDELEHIIKTNQYNKSFRVLEMKARFYHETVSMLIGDTPLVEDSNGSDDDALYDRDQAYYASQMIRLVFLGSYGRAKYQSSRWEDSTRNTTAQQRNPVNSTYAYFFQCIAIIGCQKSKNLKGSNLPASVEHCINTVKRAFECSQWNWKNKLCLLLAERHSYRRNDTFAQIQYKAAIEASQESHFIHEEGLGKTIYGSCVANPVFVILLTPYLSM